MFGRTPAPYVFHMWQLEGGISPANHERANTLPTSTPYALGRLVLRNHGTTVAKDLYVNYSFRLPGPKCMLYAPNIREWIHNKSMRDWHHIIAPQGYRLPPGGMAIPVQFRAFLAAPFDKPLWYEISFGCEGSQVFRIVRTVSIDDLRSAYSAFVSSVSGHEAGQGLARAVFGADAETEYRRGFD
jgi:hypothetical protein